MNNTDTSELKKTISQLLRPKKEQKEPKATKQYFVMKRKTKSKQ